MEDCDCGTCYDCILAWAKKHPGTRDFTCEFCGVYTASKPHCNKCEED